MPNSSLIPLRSLFHVCPTWLRSGSIIRGGNYGRIVTNNGVSSPHWYRESVLENVRQADYASKPSRMSSAFVCEDIEVARFFQQTQCANGLIYEVETVNDHDSLNWHAADFNYVQELPNLKLNIIDVAHLYWKGTQRVKIASAPNLVCTEWIAETDFRILKEVV